MALRVIDCIISGTLREVKPFPKNMNDEFNEMPALDNCPKCGADLPPSFSAGKVVCHRCGWTDEPKNAAQSSFIKRIGDFLFSPSPKPEPTLKKSVDAGDQGLRNFGAVIFVMGCWMLLIGFFYDTTTETGLYDRTHNIGEISTKSTYTNTGGFLAVCGAIFSTYGSRQPRDDNRNQ